MTPTFDRRLYDWGLWPRFADASLDNFDVTGDATEKKAETLGECLAFADAIRETGTSENLGLLGTTGTGKTHLAVGILRAVCATGEISGEYVTLIDWFNRLKAAVRGHSADAYDRIVDQVRGPALLVLDEVGGQLDTEWEQATLFDALNRRYNACLPTVAISNLSIDATQKILGPRAFDRLFAVGTIARCDWRSGRAAHPPKRLPDLRRVRTADHVDDLLDAEHRARVLKQYRDGLIERTEARDLLEGNL